MLLRFLLRQYRNVYRFDSWMIRHFTITGQLLLGVMLASAVFGVDIEHSNTYQLFVWLVALMLPAMLNAIFLRLKISATRQLPRFGTVGQTLCYSLTLHPQSRKQYDRLKLIDQLQDDLPSEFEVRRYFRLQQRPWHKRSITYRQWLRYLAWWRGGSLAAMELPTLSKSLTLKLSFIPLRRGSIYFAKSYIALPDLLGLFCRLIAIDIPVQQRCIILPRRYPVRNLFFTSGSTYQAGGVALASSVGNATEFTHLRDYQHGDPLNRIHWQSYAKQGQLIVKNYQDEYFVRRALLLDTYQGGASAQQFEAAVSIAASLSVSDQQNEALLDLLFIEGDSHCFTTGRGVDQVTLILEVLSAVQSSDKDNFADLQFSARSHLASCNNLICVLMHWDETRQIFIEQLQASLTVIVLLIHDGTLSREHCHKPPRQLHLIDYHKLSEQLAAL